MMNEVFPVVAGAVIALVVNRLATVRQRITVLVLLSLLFGVTASLISGELFVSWIYIAFDTGLVLITAAVSTLVLEWWLRRSEELRVKS